MDFRIISASFCLTLGLALSAFAAPTEPQLRYYVITAGGADLGDGAFRKNVDLYTIDNRVYARRWPNSFPPFPTDSQLVPQATAEAALSIPKRFRKIEAGAIVEMTPEEKDVVRANEAAAEAAALAVRQAAKPNPLKNAEKKMVTYLVNEGAMATNALSVTPAVVEAAYEIWDALPNTQGDNKAAKYNRLLKKITLRGGSEFDVYAHP